ncbi:hypothetical protein RFI_00452 [Reticulomyxa filosa]|uniref:Uncharacterized protein n=1 Tax=Reticulomyxa filosa TaxID=46433 RepID=X6PDN2_RETFI|nr:hypothetical protein RFI_00452 [Reticulomyxa filosa]|eukprot:ETO36610.1 hypothetical protein RFI_00452 [Reticulomyxa filosa]
MEQNEDYIEDDLLDPSDLFGSCDIEKRLYVDCLKNAKTERREKNEEKGHNKNLQKKIFIFFLSFALFCMICNLVKDACLKEGQELDLCEQKREWRQKIAKQSCLDSMMKYEACKSFIITAAKTQSKLSDKVLTFSDCLPPFKEFMACAKDSITQKEAERRFAFT